MALVNELSTHQRVVQTWGFLERVQRVFDTKAVSVHQSSVISSHHSSVIDPNSLGKFWIVVSVVEKVENRLHTKERGLLSNKEINPCNIKS